jgi:hypothetical protein
MTTGQVQVLDQTAHHTIVGIPNRLVSVPVENGSSFTMAGVRFSDLYLWKTHEKLMKNIKGHEIGG